MLGAVALIASLALAPAARGIVINLYGGASETGLRQDHRGLQRAGRRPLHHRRQPAAQRRRRPARPVRPPARGPGRRHGHPRHGRDLDAEFAEAGWIRELTPEQKAAADANTLEPPIRSATWEDKQYAIAKHTNVQLLWYRKSLVPTSPTTFDEMISMSEQLKAQGKPYEIGFAAAQYEGYVVNINNMITGYGGTIVNEDSPAPTSTTRRCRR